MIHATMFVNQGVEVNLARRALHGYADLRDLIPDEGGYIANIFNNQHGHNLDHCIELIHSAIHENREQHRRRERDRKAKARGETICGNCDAVFKKARMAQTYTTWGNAYDQETCPHCGAPLD